MRNHPECITSERKRPKTGDNMRNHPECITVWALMQSRPFWNGTMKTKNLSTCKGCSTSQPSVFAACCTTVLAFTASSFSLEVAKIQKYRLIWVSRWSKAPWTTSKRIQSCIAPSCPFFLTLLGCVHSFDMKQGIFCLPPPRHSTGEEVSDPIEKVRGVLGTSYNMELHYAVGHLRHLDGASSSSC